MDLDEEHGKVPVAPGKFKGDSIGQYQHVKPQEHHGPRLSF